MCLIFGFMACHGVDAPVYCAVTIPGQSMNFCMVDKPINHGRGDDLISEHFRPPPKRQSCTVVSGGHPSYSNDLPGGGVTVIDPFDPESAYRTIGESLSAGYWAGSAEGIMRNKASLLSTRSFHRVIEKDVMGLSSSGPKRTQTRMPAHITLKRGGKNSLILCTKGRNLRNFPRPLNFARFSVCLELFSCGSGKLAR